MDRLWKRPELTHMSWWQLVMRVSGIKVGAKTFIVLLRRRILYHHEGWRIEIFIKDQAVLTSRGSRNERNEGLQPETLTGF